MADAPTMDLLARYLSTRDQQRSGAIKALADSFTERELRLIREASVMGYVQGVRRGPHLAKIPHDALIVAYVLDGCLSHPDLYPIITGYREDREDSNG